MNIKKKAQEIFDVIVEPVVSVTAGMFLSEVAGSIVPGIVSVVMNYRQVRAERNIEKFMVYVKERLAEFDAKLDQLSEADKSRAQEMCLPLALDFAAESKQEEKIAYIAKGFASAAMDSSLGSDFLLLYYNLLDGLSMLELRALGLYYQVKRNVCNDDYKTIMRDYGIDEKEYDMVRGRLVYSGLLEKGSIAVDVIATHGIPVLPTNADEILGQTRMRYGAHERVIYTITEFGEKFMRFFSE